MKAKKIFKKIRKSFNWLVIEKDFYPPKEIVDYYRQFGIELENDKYKVKRKKKLERAYLKAWENRDFEIDKFWTRAAYFWGFIVLIFGGYVVSSPENRTV